MLKSLFPWKHGKHNKTKVMAEQTMEDETAVQQESLLPCHVCGRTFVPRSLEKHAPVCEKNATKKRKVFDSLKQRVEGTDLALFHQKSYLKKQVDHNTAEVAPCSKQSKWKEKHIELVNAIRAAKGVETVMTPPQKRTPATTSSSSSHGRCPSCDRQFGPKAFDRHVEWCKEHKARIQRSPANVLLAKERLEARTKYRVPPLRQSQRSLNREKYSPTVQRQDSISSVKSSSSISLQRAPSLRKPRSVVTVNKNAEKRADERKREKSLPKIEKLQGDYKFNNYKESVSDNNLPREAPIIIKASPKIETPKGFHTKRVLPPKKINNVSVNNSLEAITVSSLLLESTSGRKMVTWKDTVSTPAVNKSIASKEKTAVKIVSSEILPIQISKSSQKIAPKIKSSPSKIDDFLNLKSMQKIYCDDNFSTNDESSRESIHPDVAPEINFDLDDFSSDSEEIVPALNNPNYKLDFLPAPNEFTSSETQNFLDEILSTKPIEQKITDLEGSINSVSKSIKRKIGPLDLSKLKIKNKDKKTPKHQKGNGTCPKKILSASRKKKNKTETHLESSALFDDADLSITQKYLKSLENHTDNTYNNENDDLLQLQLQKENAACPKKILSASQVKTVSQEENKTEVTEVHLQNSPRVLLDDTNLTVTQKYLKILENHTEDTCNDENDDLLQPQNDDLCEKNYESDDSDLETKFLEIKYKSPDINDDLKASDELYFNLNSETPPVEMKEQIICSKNCNYDLEECKSKTAENLPGKSNITDDVREKYQEKMCVGKNKPNNNDSRKLISKQSMPIINGQVHDDEILLNDKTKVSPESNEPAKTLKGSHDSGIYSEEVIAKCSTDSYPISLLNSDRTTLSTDFKESTVSLALNLQSLSLSDGNFSDKFGYSCEEKDKLSLRTIDSDISCTVLEQESGDRFYYFNERNTAKKLNNITIQTNDYSIILNNNPSDVSMASDAHKRVKCKIRGNEIKVYNAGKGQIKVLLHDNNEPPLIIKEQNVKSRRISEVNYDENSSSMYEATSLESFTSKFDNLETGCFINNNSNSGIVNENSSSLGSLTRQFESLGITSSEEFSTFSLTNNRIIRKCPSETLLNFQKIQYRNYSAGDYCTKKSWSHSNTIDYMNVKKIILLQEKLAINDSEIIDQIAEDLKTWTYQNSLPDSESAEESKKMNLLHAKLQLIESSSNSIIYNSKQPNTVVVSSRKSSANPEKCPSEKSLISIYTNENQTKFDSDSIDERFHYNYSTTSVRNCQSDDCLSKCTSLKASNSQDITRFSSSASITTQNDRHKILEIAAQEFVNEYNSNKYVSGEIEYFVPKKRRKLAIKSLSSEDNSDKFLEIGSEAKNNQTLTSDENLTAMQVDDSQLEIINNISKENLVSRTNDSPSNSNIIQTALISNDLKLPPLSAKVNRVSSCRSNLSNYSPRVLTILETLMIANTKIACPEQKSLVKSKPFLVPLDLCEKLIYLDSEKLPKIYSKIDKRNKSFVDAFEETIKLPKIESDFPSYSAIVLNDANGIYKCTARRRDKFDLEDKVIQCPSFNSVFRKSKSETNTREGLLVKQDKNRHSSKDSVYLEYKNSDERPQSKDTTTPTYDPFESAQRQFMELLESDDFNKFELTKTPLIHTPRPHTSDTTPVTKKQPSPKTTKKTIKSANLLPRNIDSSNNIKRGSVIDPPSTFQDNLDLIHDDFEYLENLINNQFGDENKNNGDSFFLHEKGADSFNLNDILNLSERKYSDDMSSIDPRLINENDNLSIPDHFKVDDYSPTTTDTDITIQNESINYYNAQLDKKVTENEHIDHYSAQFDKKISDESDNYFNKTDKKNQILEPLVLAKTEGKRELKRSVSSVSKSSKADDEDFVAKNKQAANKGNKTKGKVLNKSDSSVGKSKGEKKSLSSFKKSMTYEPSPKPSLKNREDVINYFDDQTALKTVGKHERKTPEKEIHLQFENSLSTPIKPEDLFAVDDEMYEEYKKYEELYLKEKENAKNTKRTKQKPIDPNYGLLTASEEDDLLAKSNKLNNDSAYGSLNRKTLKHRIRSAKLTPLEQKHPVDSTSSSGSEHCPSSPATVTSTNTKMSKFCHECGNKYPVNTAKFCVECGIRRLVL